MDDLISGYAAKYALPERIEFRKKAEASARALLQTFIADGDPEVLKQFLVAADQDWRVDHSSQDRFGITFRGANGKEIQAQAPLVREWARRFMESPVEECFDLIGQFCDPKTKPIKNAGPGFASFLLYLRDPEFFAVRLQAMIQGLEISEGKPFAGDTGEDYRRYCTSLAAFRARHALQPQALDIVLSVIAEAAKKANKDAQVEGAIASAGLASSSLEMSNGFSSETFKWLAQLDEHPTYEFYSANKDAYQSWVLQPVQTLLMKVVEQLPPEMTHLLETRKGLFSRIPKNDHGHGGAWNHYWGALYPKGGKRTSDAQLFVFVSKAGLDFGFSVGQGADMARQRFMKNLEVVGDQVHSILANAGSIPGLRYGQDKGGPGKPEWDQSAWLKDPQGMGIRAGVRLTPEFCIGTTAEHLVERVTACFKALYPLFQLATHDQIELALGLTEDPEVQTEQPSYSLEECAAETGLGLDLLGRWIRAIQRKGQAVVYGPPGTGKTFVAERLARHLVSETNGTWDLVQLHPAYAYEDFIQGIRPQSGPNGLTYPVVPGRFLEFCKEAEKRQGPCVLILDELNRANLSQVFGELMYLLEYRDQEIKLAAGGSFRIPQNVFLIGTMNTADRSIALVDHALRRRFAFLQLRPLYGILGIYQEQHGFEAKGLISVLERINKRIDDPHYELGISFFMRPKLAKELEDIWRMEIEPYLEEFFFNEAKAVQEFRWELIQGEVLPA